jgi:hypothetical protein
MCGSSAARDSRWLLGSSNPMKRRFDIRQLKDLLGVE